MMNRLMKNCLDRRLGNYGMVAAVATVDPERTHATSFCILLNLMMAALEEWVCDFYVGDTLLRTFTRTNKY
jgi:hypothetical protein